MSIVAGPTPPSRGIDNVTDGGWALPAYAHVRRMAGSVSTQVLVSVPEPTQVPVRSTACAAAPVASGLAWTPTMSAANTAAILTTVRIRRF